MGDDEIKPGSLARDVERLRELGASPDEIREYLDLKKQELAALPPSTPEQELAAMPDEKPGAAAQALGAVASVVRDIPGMEAAQAGTRALVRGQSYRDALSDIRGAEDAAPKIATVPLRLAGAGLAAAAMPGSTALRQGAMYGIASGALKSDPDAGLLNRGASAAFEGAVGGTVGKAAEMAGPLLRSFKAPDVAGNIVRRTTAAAKAAKPLYGGFRALGDLPQTQPLQDILSLPVVQRAMETVRAESPRLAKLADTNAEILDAVYKRVGSKAFKAQHGFETGEAREALLSAIEDAAQQAGGSYVAPVKVYAKAMRKADAVKRGAIAMRNTANTYGAVPSKAMTDSPEALAQWAQRATRGERGAAVEGVLGRLSREPKLASVRTGITSGVPLPFPSRAVREAPALLRTLGEQPSLRDQLLRALATGGAVTATSPFADLLRRDD